MIQPDTIIYSKRKTLSIAIDPFGRLTVRAPKGYSRARIEAFLQEKEAWILRKKSERQGTGIELPPENLHGYKLLLLGKETEIALSQTKYIVYDKAQNCVVLPEKKSQEKLVKWLKENAKRIFSNVTEEWAKKMDVSYASVTITSARGRWGSCSAENALRYSFRLLYAPKGVIEYVIVHELAHVKHKNHSPLFWREVEKYIPDWKEKRAWLKKYSVLMQVF